MTLRLPSMPLAAKDLAQMSGRSGTYHLRFWVGLFLLVPVVFVMVFSGTNQSNSAALGTIAAALEFTLLNIAIYVLLPVIAADAIASEKESATMPLLVLTGMTPGGVVIQKYLSRLVPMASLLLLSSPVFAVSYSYGGISTDHIGSMLLRLAIASVQVAAIAIFASALCRNTTGAIVATYATGLIFYFGPYLLVELDHVTIGILPKVAGPAFGARGDHYFLLSWCPLALLWPTTGPDVILKVTCILVSTVVFLLLAERLVSRSIRTGGQMSGQKFRSLDRLFLRIDTLLGSTHLGRDPNALPYDKPVAWRGMNRLGLARRHHLVRFILLVEAPVVLIMSLLLVSKVPEEGWWLFAVGTWVICAIVLLNQSTLTFLRERADQTMEILLTTPLDAGELVLQHYAVLRRLLLILILPCATAFVPLVVRTDRAEWPLIAFVSAMMAMRTVVLIGLVAGILHRNRFVALAVTLVSVICVSVPWTIAIGIWVFVPWLGIVAIPAFLLLMRSGLDRQLKHATHALSQGQLTSTGHTRRDWT